MRYRALESPGFHPDVRQAVLTLLLICFGPLTGALSAAPAPSDTGEMAPFIDGLMAAQQSAHHFAGAVVVIVRDGKVTFEQGYGYADFERRQPVDPRRTLFRIASNSKMFVWTAVMQLVEQGKLDLRTDVNHYLKGIQIPRTFKDPITLEHLMTHTAGFEDRVIGLFTKTPDTIAPIAELMRRDMPRRIYPPGRVTAYSNYGTTLAALIVEQVSGLPYEKYVNERILAPLGMKYATLKQPVAAELAPMLSKGYRWTGGWLHEEPFEYVPWAPCGAMSVSGEDMGRFMMANLNDGALGDARIMLPATARAMRQRLISFSPQINGMLHGFIEMNWNGAQIFGHLGDTIWFHSLTAMVPAEHMGVFVAYNTDSGMRARDEFFVSFFDHFLPRPLAPEPAVPGKTNLRRFIGSYAPARVSESDWTSLLKLTGAVSVTASSDGYLVSRQADLFGLLGLGNNRWRQVAPLVFAQDGGKRRAVFREDQQGRIADVCGSPFCIVAFEKQPWWNSPAMEFGWIAISLAILLGAFIGVPLAALLQRQQPIPAAATLARFTLWFASLAFIAGVVAFDIGLSDQNALLAGVPRSVRVAQLFWTVGLILSVVLIVFSGVAWRRHWWNVAGRFCLSLVSLAAVATDAWLFYWKLIG